jgi:hypothetical protein
MKRIVLAGTATALAILGLSGPAQASVGVSSFNITPSTTQAGASGSSGPSLHIVANFSDSWGDSPKDLTLSLAPGLLANPTVPATCSSTAFSLDICPPSSWIGTGFVTASIPAFFGFNAPVGADAYLVQPTSSTSVARIGLILNVLGIPLESTAAPVNVRTKTGDVGLDLDFMNLPNNWNGLRLQLTSLNLTIFGQVLGKAFTRNPTSCTSATSRLVTNSYSSRGTTAGANSSFTPTGCSSLAYNPQLSAAATLDPGDSGVSYTAGYAQSATEAATSSLKLTTPPSLSPSFAALAGCATAADGSVCGQLGTATATTPFLPAPLTGQLQLISHSGAPPTVRIAFASPVALTLDSTTTLSSSPLKLTSTFVNLPDIPLTKLAVTFNGGPGSLFVAQASSICTPPQPTLGDFVGANGATAQQSVATTLLGCP